MAFDSYAFPLLFLSSCPLCLVSVPLSFPSPFYFNPSVAWTLQPESQVPALRQPGAACRGRLLLLPAARGSPRAEVTPSGSPRHTGGCPAHSPAQGRVPSNLILTQPWRPHRAAWCLVKGVGVQSSPRRGGQATLPIEKTAAAREIDRKPDPACWQGGRRRASHGAATRLAQQAPVQQPLGTEPETPSGLGRHPGVG